MPKRPRSYENEAEYDYVVQFRSPLFDTKGLNKAARATKTRQNYLQQFAQFETWLNGMEYASTEVIKHRGPSIGYLIVHCSESLAARMHHAPNVYAVRQANRPMSQLTKSE